jgi:pimeloyl-ACP methyl ester carboxylesterase
VSLSWTLGGLAWLPVAQGGSLPSIPIIAFQHGTEVDRLRAPSFFEPNPVVALGGLASRDPEGAIQTYLECMIGAMMATKGYIVVMTDYPGFGGDTGPHPYVHRALGSSVRDIVAKAAIMAGGDWGDRVSWNGQIYLIGYSEGGYTTMVGAQALQESSLGPNVVAAIPCDGSYDLSGTMLPRILARNTPEPAPYYVPYLIFGYNSVYGPTSAFAFSSIFQPPYDTSLPPFFDGNHGSATINAAMPSAYPYDVLTSGAKADLGNPSSALFQKLQLNDAYRGWTGSPTMKIQMIQCTGDDVIPPGNAEAALSAFNSANVPAVIYVDPITVTGVSDQVHARGFPSAILRGFQIIAGGP